LKLWLRLGGENAITLRAWLLLAPISIFLTAAFVPEGSTGNYFYWLIVGTLAHLTTGAVLLIARYSYLSKRPRKPRPLSAIITFLVAGAIRGATVSYTTQVFGLIENPEYLLRIRSGAILVVFWFAFAAIIIDASIKYREAFEDIQSKIAENEVLEKSIADSITSYRTQIIDQVTAIISTAFQRARSHHQLADVIEDVVRPLSRDLYESKDYPEIASQVKAGKKQKRKISFLATVKTMFERTPFNPMTVALISLGGTASSRLWTAPLDSFVLDVLLNFIWINLALGFARKITAKRPRLSALLTIPVWLVVGVVSGLITEFTSTGRIFEQLPTTLLLSSNVIFVGIFAAALYAYEFQRDQKIKQLSLVLEKANWLRAKSKQALWSERRRLARLVHSGVQSRILATASRIGRNGSDAALSESDLEQLRKECFEAMLASESPEPLASFLQDSKEVWAGAIEITSNQNSKVFGALDLDEKAAIATLEVVREAINNAVKHSKATKIKIDFDLKKLAKSKTAVLDLTIANDGVFEAKEKTSSGIGSRVIDEVSQDWSLNYSDNQAILKVKIPIKLS